MRYSGQRIYVRSLPICVSLKTFQLLSLGNLSLQFAKRVEVETERSVRERVREKGIEKKIREKRKRRDGVRGYREVRKRVREKGIEKKIREKRKRKDEVRG